MPTTPNLEVSRRLIEEIVNRGRFGLASALIAPDSVHHEIEEVAPAVSRGPDGFVQFVELYRFAFPDLRMTIEDAIEAGDRAVVRFRMEGTHRNLLMGIEPSGRRFSVTGIRIDRFVRGRIVESWMSWDALGMLRQLGALELHRRPAASARPARPASARSVSGRPVPADLAAVPGLTAA